MKNIIYVERLVKCVYIISPLVLWRLLILEMLKCFISASVYAS